ncbi:MAG TPA: hypothetical protein VK152_08575 [Paludibacter sp.]|nr:hypothetical protein [Paludibacter sp.]
MKKSNIIIMAFSVFILASILVLFIFGKKHNDEEKINHISWDTQLSPFNVIVTEKGADVHIDYSDTARIGVEYLDKKKNLKLFSVKGDTLFVKGGLRTFVKCPKLNALICKGSFWVGVSTYNSDTLKANIMGGRVNFYTADNIDEEKGIGKIVKPVLVLHASQKSEVDIYKLLTKLEATISDSSSVNSRLLVENANANLYSNSTLQLSPSPSQSAVTRDSTSIFRIY